MGAPAPGFGHGKVILLGEHTVVYGTPALALALSQGVAAHPAGDAPALSLVDGARAGDGSRAGAALAAVAGTLQTHGVETARRLRIESDLPVGAGLGSSAALSVAIARSLAPGAPLPWILDAAAAAEAVFHGRASGVDHTTSALGGLLRFQRGQEPRPLDCAAPLLVVGQMEPGADTGALVAGVARRREALPAACDPLIRWLGEVAEQGVEALQQRDLPRLGGLMNLAHGGLVGLGVSTAALDRGCHAARAAGALGAKLTGAGGGGCLIALCEQTASANRVARALREAGALATLISHPRAA